MMTRKITIKIKSKLGFTMIEMTIVLIMIGILTASLAPLLLRQFTNNKEGLDRTALLDAQTAIINYAISFGGIPNPLNESVATPCANTSYQINPILPTASGVATSGVGMMPPPSSLASTCQNAVSAFDANSWGAFGDNTSIATPLKMFQLDVSDALLSYSVTNVASIPAFTGGDRVVFCQAVQQQLSSGYCSDLTSPTPSACATANKTWISGGYCYNINSVVSNQNPYTCTGAVGTWYAAPQVCQDTTGDHSSTACTSYSPAAFVLYSTGNDRKPNMENDDGTSKLGTQGNRIYESDTRGINNSNEGTIHYDDQVVSYPLSALARDCREKMNVAPEVMNCAPGQKYVGSLTNNLAAASSVTYSFGGVASSSVPGNGYTLYDNSCQQRSATLSVSAVGAGTVANTLDNYDANKDGRVDVYISASGVASFSVTTQ